MRIYDFIREHVAPFNSVIFTSVTVAGVLDFLAPQAPYLAWLSYALAGLVLLAMVLEVRTLRGRAAGRGWSVRFLGRLREPPGPLWKSPAWQVFGVIVLIALVLGQASKARADSGGLIAGAAPNLRNVQMLLLGLQQDSQRIQSTLNVMDTKVDSIHASVGGLEAALKGPLDYLEEGDYPYLRKHVAEGKRLPQSSYHMVWGLNRKRDDRLDLLEMYVSNGFDIHRPVPLSVLTYGTNIDDLTTIKNVDKLNAWTQKRIQEDAMMLFMSCKTMDLLAYAYVAGDKPLADWLVNKGMSLDTKYPCEWAGTSWTMTIQDIQTIVSSPAVSAK